ncbi:hypothetical protein [Bradyrhizobium sp. NP1]|uniref:hypothetical protein n=1 Tax=Bradyrhizobium sp. NP1 TaxID=3049772 RepID=UPI0025A65F15|nr:hypothetical protein [Bradyrhizobium sp. NP1]WJR78565.1 hypothetical protein QOU61_01760 [Bradyrhizobium sp. NP1]
MTAQSKPYPVVQMLTETFARWLKHRRELNEMRQIDRADFDRIASELRVTPGELGELVWQGPHAADELPKLLAALGLDEEGLARTQALILRDMERVCAICAHKVRCDHDIIAGTSAEHYEDYCPNASTIALIGEPADSEKRLTALLRE